MSSTVWLNTPKEINEFLGFGPRTSLHPTAADLKEVTHAESGARLMRAEWDFPSHITGNDTASLYKFYMECTQYDYLNGGLPFFAYIETLSQPVALQTISPLFQPDARIPKYPIAGISLSPNLYMHVLDVFSNTAHIGGNHQNRNTIRLAQPLQAEARGLLTTGAPSLTLTAIIEEVHLMDSGRQYETLTAMPRNFVAGYLLDMGKIEG